MEMEATGVDAGGHGPSSWTSWSCRCEQTGSSYYYSTIISSGGSSSSSGTIVSAAYTSNASRLSSSASMEAAMHFDYFSIHEEEADAERVKSPLAHEFFDAPLVNCGIKGGGSMGVLERWLTELGVAWVLHLASSASAWEELDKHTSDGARCWIRALHEITRTIRSVAVSLFPDHGSVGLLPSIYEEEEDPKAEGSILELLLFARFIQETMLKMLAFVDFIVALDPGGIPVQALHQKIHILLRVLCALSDALTEIQVLFLSLPPSAEVERIRGVVNLLYAKNAKARESIRSTLEDIRSHIMEPMVDDSPGAQTPQGSSDIHKVTLIYKIHRG
ncbi:uncharacterized protein [Miscanthus floridulus]|uniref:uncharacterized protein n=1 Tax=Miscanthus floridulus TaxID=154761 RepID=UPI003459A148